MKKKFPVLAAIMLSSLFALNSCNKELQSTASDETGFTAQSLRGNVDQVNVFKGPEVME